MSRKGDQFSGLTVAMITPFSGGDVDEARLRSNVDWLIGEGVHGLVPCGTTGESPTLSHDEHERVISVVCEQAAGRAKVVAGTGSNSTAEAVRLTRAAEKAGADGTLQVAPYYNKPTQEGFYQHFKAVADASGLPIMLYNIPGRTGKKVEADTICRLAELPTVVAIKEATGELDMASEIIGGSDLTVLSGDDSLTLPLMSVGAAGIVSVAGNIVPQDLLKMIAAWNDGDIAGAQAMHAKLFPLCRDMLGLSSNPIPLKAAMKALGRDTGEVRLPLVTLGEAESKLLGQTLTSYGLL